MVDALATNWNRWKRIYLFPPPDLIQACLQKLQDFGGSALVIVPVLPSAPWGPEFRLVRTPLDVDLDIGQWVQGECRKLERKRHISFALSVSQGPLLPEIRSTRCTSPFERPPRIHQGPVRTLLERFPAMVNL